MDNPTVQDQVSTAQDVKMAAMEEYVACYGPTLPVRDLIFELNRIYHGFEAEDYDARHPAMTRDLPPVWREMVGRAQEIGPGGPWNVLDFGCGTGFEASQLLDFASSGKVDQLVCYDPAPEMVALAKAKVSPRLRSAVFTDDITALAPLGPFHAVISNAVLHHLPDPQETVDLLNSLTASDAVWLLGHEPSRRFYLNPECAATYRRFLSENTWRRWITPAKIAARFKTTVGLAPNPAKRTAQVAVERGLLNTPPPDAAIIKLVDVGVPHSTTEVTIEERGFDFESMSESLLRGWSIDWAKTYNFMGAMNPHTLSGRWATEAAALAKRFPNDGASFCALARREP